MSTGYFVMNRKSACREYAVRKFLGLLRLLLVWDILEYAVRVIVRAVRGQDLSAFGPVGLARAIARSVIQKGVLWDTMWHFWYLAALMILYLLLPLLYRLYIGDRSPDERFSNLLCLWAGLALTGILAQLVSYWLGQPFQKFFCQAFRLWTWLQYLILGGLAPRIRTALEKRLSLPLHGLCLFVMTVFVMAYQNIAGRALLHNLYAEFFYDDAFTVLWVLLLYTFLLRTPIPRLLHRILEIMSPLTLGIYIVHPLFLKAVRMYYPAAGLKAALATYLAVFAVSALSVLLMSRIPVIRRLVTA
jgi:surface polysaccharide O-acyltransferase-like enzyme